MKIDYVDLRDNYDTFWKIQQNMLEILKEIETGLAQYRNMETFQGAAALSAKAYLEEVHSKVIDTFEMLLMEFEVRMLLMKNEFSANVDDGEVPLLDSDYIQEVIDKTKSFETDFVFLAPEINSALAPVATIANIAAPFEFQNVLDEFTTVKTNGDTVLSDLSDFDTAHKADMEAINAVFSNLDQAFALIGSTCTNKEINYTPGQLVTVEWSQNLAQYRLDAVAYADANDPGFYESCYIATIIDSGIPLLELFNQTLDYASEINEINLEIQEIYKLYKSGVTYSMHEFNGKVYLQLSDASKMLVKTKQMREIAESLELNIGKKAAEQLFSEYGLRIFDLAKNEYVNPRLLSNVAENGDALSDVARQLEGKNGYSIGALDVLGWAVTIGVELHSEYYDEQSGRYITPSSESTSDALRNAGIEIGVDVAKDYAEIGVTQAFAAAVGGIGGFCIIGPLGAIAGIAIGAAISMVLDLEYGEPPETIIDQTKNVFEDVDDFFDTCWLRFWE